MKGVRPCQCGKCNRCRLYLTNDAYNRHWGGPGLDVPRTDLPCVHLRSAIGEEDCPPCREKRGGRVRLKVYQCDKYGQCTLGKPLEGKGCCAGRDGQPCPAYEPDTFKLVAPIGSGGQHFWLGRSAWKPWQYKVTVSLPHLETPEPLRVLIDLLRLQTVKPYILVIDTGSSPAICREIERLRADDLEIHFLRGHGYIHAAGAVPIAQDLGQALCRTDHLYFTHVDCFPMRRDLLEWLLGQCGAMTPAIGYRMNDRGFVTRDWEKCIGHMCLMLHMPTIRKAGVSWNMEQAYELAGWTGRAAAGWPDVETGFSLDAIRKGLPLTFIGQESHGTQIDHNIHHVRSYRLVREHGATGMALVKQSEMQAALAEARLRAARWRSLGGTP